MKYGIVAGARHEAARGLSGQCPACGAALIAKCGDLRVHHWAHKGARTCDAWWEPETEWHREWKDRFPKDSQEIIQRAEDGEKHIADVKTKHGHVLEFQHSPISNEERAAREAFYRRMSWIVDGTRRKRDLPSFSRSLGAAHSVKIRPFTASFLASDCALLRDWAGSRVPVFFDFGNDGLRQGLLPSVLWRLDPKSPNGTTHVSPVLKAELLRAYTEGRPLKGMDRTTWLNMEYHLQRRKVRHAGLPQPLNPQPFGVQQYMALKRRARSRVRF